MKKLLKYLHNPYPVVYHRWKSILTSSLIVYLVLAVLQPFGISSISHHKWGVLLGYGLITALFQVIPLYLFPLLFPAYHKEQQWTVGKQILNMLWILLFIGTGNWLYSAWLFDLPLWWGHFLLFIGLTAVIGVFPIAIFTLINQNRRLTHHLKEAVDINACLKKPASVPQVVDEAFPILFQGGTKESLEVDASDILYVEADGNYVKVVYRKEDKTASKLLRATMKQAEDAIADCPFLQKCHRAFLVNVRAVEKVSGNSQGYRLSLNGCADEVPVSRAYSKVLKEQIANE